MPPRRRNATTPLPRYTHLSGVVRANPLARVTPNLGGGKYASGAYQGKTFYCFILFDLNTFPAPESVLGFYEFNLSAAAPGYGQLTYELAARALGETLEPGDQLSEEAEILWERIGGDSQEVHPMPDTYFVKKYGGTATEILDRAPKVSPQQVQAIKKMVTSVVSNVHSGRRAGLPSARRNPDTPARIRLTGFGKTTSVSPSVEAFLRAFFDASYPSPLSPNERTERVLSGMDVVVEVTPQHGGVHIDEVRALVRRQGAGTQAMRFLTDLADQHGVKLSLYPMPFGDEKMDTDALVRFYRRHGFRWEDEEEPEEGQDMVRWPRRPNPARKPARRNPDGPYLEGKKYHGPVPEVRYLPISVIYRAEIDHMPETLRVSDRVAEQMDFSEPVDVTAHRFPSSGWASVYPPRMRRPVDESDDAAPEVVLRDGHHRLAAAIQTGRGWLPVNLTAINAKGEKLNALVALSAAIEARMGRSNPARTAKPPTLAAAGLPEVWFHGTQKTFGKLKAQGGACIWLADKAGAMAYATPHYGRRSAIRLIEMTLASDTRVVDLADASDPIVREFIRLDASASNMRWHGREDVTDAELAAAIARWNAAGKHYGVVEARAWSKAYFRKAGADALLVRDVKGWGGHEEMPSLCLLNAKKVVGERDVAPDLSLVRAEDMPKYANPSPTKKFSNTPLTAEETKLIGLANVYLMDWVVDGWGPLPARIAKLEAKPTALTNAEKRELIDWFYRNAPGDWS